MIVRQLGAEDVDIYREIRLAALQADPGAFASSYEREVKFDEARWRQRLTVGPDGRPIAVFAVEAERDQLLGTAGVVYTEHHPAPMLVAMWVRPSARGLGVGRKLIDATVDWARDRGESEIVLWVVRGNDAAIALYESCGFTATGNLDTVPDNSCAEELEMMRTIAAR